MVSWRSFLPQKENDLKEFSLWTFRLKVRLLQEQNHLESKRTRGGSSVLNQNQKPVTFRQDLR